MKHAITIGVMAGVALIGTAQICSRRRQGAVHAGRVASFGVNPLSARSVDAVGQWVETSEIVLNDTVFYDPIQKVIGKIPKNWFLQSSNRRAENETSLVFHMRNYPNASLAVYYRFMGGGPLDKKRERDLLREAVHEKIIQRSVAGFEDYKVSLDMIERDIHGHSALSWVANYRNAGVAWVEHLTRIQAPSYTMLIFLNVPTVELDAAKPGYDEIVSTTEVK
jgi:hypothetical protein